ncbi:hypothetical protein NUW58_g5212 [Xylaria curta]|uniref:Uncharacterized protein n=1 Tax=Xylaria curta TaxID=42375 RepID=A0ACC1P487_9PEZI|nr:hypothetical protein NUW58_g5212 [Xylaria curta]
MGPVRPGAQEPDPRASDFDFSRVVAAAEVAWREKLSVIKADHTGLNLDLLKTFWSGLYRTMLSPQDYTGENPLWKSDEPYYDSFYCIWDSFRAQHPLLTIIDPEIQTDMVRALIDIYKHEGKLPDCRMSFSKGFTQGGSNADVVLADALIKNLTRGIDWALGYEAVVSDAEQEPSDWSISGRGGIESWRTLGYIPLDDDDKNGTGPFSRTISRTVEYAYDDFTIALMARALGHKADETKAAAAARAAANEDLPPPSAFAIDDASSAQGDDNYVEFEHRQQLQMMREQDQQLDGVFVTVGNLRRQADDMGRELEEQHEMLEHVDTLADRVGGRLQTGMQKLGYVMRRNEDRVIAYIIDTTRSQF